MRSRCFAIALASVAIGIAGLAYGGELTVLVPVMAGKQALTQAAPKDGAQAPIVKLSSNQPAAKSASDAIAQAVLREAKRGAVKFMIDLDERAQRLAGAKQPTPTYILVSDDSKEIAGRGFWLSGADNKLTWKDEPFVNMAVDKRTVDDGSFEEAFAYEMGRVILRRLLPRLPDGLSRAPHSSLAITDYPTAFAEGFAIHFQGLARLLTQNANLRARDAGLPYKPLVGYAPDNFDLTLRVRGMRDNLFVQRQLPMPLKVGDATALFDPTHFKNAQQMLSSEGVIATLFYHLMLLPGDNATQRANRYQSLLISLRTLNAQKLTRETPMFINLVRVHVQRLTVVRAQWIGTVLDLTYGATVGSTVLHETTRLAALGLERHDDEFSVTVRRMDSALNALKRRVVANPKLLDDAIGSELWIAVLRGNDVATLNLNTAEQNTLMTILNIEPLDAELLLADRWAHGPYKNVDDFIARRRASTTLRKLVEDGHALALKTDGYRRR